MYISLFMRFNPHSLPFYFYRVGIETQQGNKKINSFCLYIFFLNTLYPTMYILGREYICSFLLSEPLSSPCLFSHLKFAYVLSVPSIPIIYTFIIYMYVSKLRGGGVKSCKARHPQKKVSTNLTSYIISKAHGQSMKFH